MNIPAEAVGNRKTQLQQDGTKNFQYTQTGKFKKKKKKNYRNFVRNPETERLLYLRQM